MLLKLADTAVSKAFFSLNYFLRKRNSISKLLLF